MRLGNPYTTQSNNFFGFCEHGNFNSQSTLTQFDSSDGQPCYKFFKDFTINAGHTVTTSAPCCGLYIYVYGNATINGALTMTNRGIYSPPSMYPNGYAPLGMSSLVLNDLRRVKMVLPSSLAAPTVAGSGGGCGGGGTYPDESHFIYHVGTVTYHGAPGGKAGVFSGGAGGPGIQYSVWQGGYSTTCNPGTAAEDYGGMAGYGIAYYDSRGVIRAGSGAGNPSKIYDSYSPTMQLVNSPLYTGTGGVLYLIVRGTLTIGNTAIISAAGINGQPGVSNVLMSEYYVAGRDGTGSGGGSINIAYTNLVGNLTPNAAGGTYAGAGSVRTYKILK